MVHPQACGLLGSHCHQPFGETGVKAPGHKGCRAAACPRPHNGSKQRMGIELGQRAPRSNRQKRARVLSALVAGLYACAAAVVRWPMASQSPPMTNHIAFSNADPAPAPGLLTTVLPKGHSA